MLRLAPTYGLVILMVGLIVLFSILLRNTFPTLLNLRSILSDKAIIALLALAAMIPMVAGRIDLTVGYGIVLDLGMITGALDGLLVEVARIDSFIAALCIGTFR